MRNRVLLSAGVIALVTASCAQPEPQVLSEAPRSASATELSASTEPAGSGSQPGRFIARCATEADGGTPGMTFFTDGSQNVTDHCLSRYYIGVQPAPGALYVADEDAGTYAPPQEVPTPATTQWTPAQPRTDLGPLDDLVDGLDPLDADPVDETGTDDPATDDPSGDPGAPTTTPGTTTPVTTPTDPSTPGGTEPGQTDPESPDATDPAAPAPEAPGSSETAAPTAVPTGTVTPETQQSEPPAPAAPAGPHGSFGSEGSAGSRGPEGSLVPTAFPRFVWPGARPGALPFS